MSLLGSTTGSVVSDIAAQVGAVDPGSEVLSSDLNTVAQSIVNDLKTIKSSTGAGGKVDRVGDTMTGDLHVGPTVISNDGSATFTLSVSAPLITATTNLTASAKITASAARKLMLRPRVLLADLGSQFCDVSQADVFVVHQAAAQPRVIKLRNTVVVPSANETMSFVRSVTFGGAPGAVISFQREDGTVIATWTSSAVAADPMFYSEFEFAQGGVWRLGANSGSAWDGTGDYGVIPGAGA